MTNSAEDVIFASLTDAESLDIMIKEGLDPQTMPTEAGRPVVQWVLDQFFQTGRRSAPTADLIRQMWRNVLDDNEISLGDGTEVAPVETAIETLKNHHAQFQTQGALKAFARRLADAQPNEYTNVLDGCSAELLDLSLLLQRKAGITHSSTAVDDTLLRYYKRAQAPHATLGMTFGIEDIDQHTFGIHPGELAVLAAGPKVGKSWFCAMVALHEALIGRTVVFFTLENSAEMTWDRIVCMAAKVSYRAFQRGALSQEEVALVEEQRHVLQTTTDLHVIMPEMGKRTIQHMVRDAQVRGAESLIIDQLTFVDLPEGQNKARWETIRVIMHELKALISTGRVPIPCLLAHQINREGVKAADAAAKKDGDQSRNQRAGRLEMYHMAEGSEVERTADFVFGLYQSAASRVVSQVRFQIMAARRETNRDWLLDWKPSQGAISVDTTYAEDDE